jgi:hypothetical protein
VTAAPPNPDVDFVLFPTVFLDARFFCCLAVRDVMAMMLVLDPWFLKELVVWNDKTSGNPITMPSKMFNAVYLIDDWICCDVFTFLNTIVCFSFEK